MSKRVLLFMVIFIALAVAGLSVSPMGDGFFHSLPDGSCVSVVAKTLPCSKNSFYFYVLIVLFSLTAGSLFLLIVNSLMRSSFYLACGRVFERHSFSYKTKTNHWLALFATT